MGMLLFSQVLRQYRKIFMRRLYPASSSILICIFIVMNTLTQAYRTTCIPTAGRLEAPIPSEYIGQELEIIIIPMAQKEPEYNAETLAAFQEARDIMSGKIKVKTYATAAEMHADIDLDPDDA
jgi:hypothetical protein